MASREEILNGNLPREKILAILKPAVDLFTEHKRMEDSIVSLEQQHLELATARSSSEGFGAGITLITILHAIYIYVFIWNDANIVSMDKITGEPFYKWYAMLFGNVLLDLNYEDHILIALFCLVSPIIVGLLIAIIIFGLLFACKRKKLKKRMISLEQKIYLDREVAILFMRDNRQYFDFLPKRYWSYEAVSLIYSLFANYRVDTFKEAFNKCEELMKV